MKTLILLLPGVLSLLTGIFFDDSTARADMHELLSWLPAASYEEIYYYDFALMPELFEKENESGEDALKKTYPLVIARNTERTISARVAYYLVADARNHEKPEKSFAINMQFGNKLLIGKGSIIKVLFTPGIELFLKQDSAFERTGTTIGNRAVYTFGSSKPISKEHIQYSIIAATDSIALISTDTKILSQAMKTGLAGTAPFFNTPEGECVKTISMEDTYHWYMKSHRTAISAINKVETGDADEPDNFNNAMICGIHTTRYPEPDSYGEQYTYIYFTEEKYAERMLDMLQNRVSVRGGVRGKQSYYLEGSCVVNKLVLAESRQQIKERVEKRNAEQ